MQDPNEYDYVNAFAFKDVRIAQKMARQWVTKVEELHFKHANGLYYILLDEASRIKVASEIIAKTQRPRAKKSD